MRQIVRYTGVCSFERSLLPPRLSVLRCLNKLCQVPDFGAFGHTLISITSREHALT
ncbi:protein of unknown function [Bradyrhizobium vignae]|uniref:Uncharacterized protein n=1 Tax=Bradyrhizobium vignae TaxID=1549949 RepID=A0A2U3Q6T4_9BRAD|nr:protein of unknown function [Bradyrhizobium vignae]